MNEANPGLDARRLLRAARQGVLATSAEGQPFASLVTPATAPDGSILLLLSDLSEHTRHLRAEPRCAVMVAGEADGPNAQTAPRLTVTGLAALEPDPALKARWIALHPYAAFYAGFGDFNLWRVRPGGGLFVGGFARAHRIRQSELAVETPDLAAAEERIIAHCNDDHAEAMTEIANDFGHDGEGWRMVACDADGFDVARGDSVRRIAWAAPADTPGAVRSALVAFAGAARNRTKTTAGRPGPAPV